MLSLLSVRILEITMNTHAVKVILLPFRSVWNVLDGIVLVRKQNKIVWRHLQNT
jgi:hypothetical protein